MSAIIALISFFIIVYIYGSLIQYYEKRKNYKAVRNIEKIGGFFLLFALFFGGVNIDGIIKP